MSYQYELEDFVQKKRRRSELQGNARKPVAVGRVDDFADSEAHESVLEQLVAREEVEEASLFDRPNSTDDASTTRSFVEREASRNSGHDRDGGSPIEIGGDIDGDFPPSDRDRKTGNDLEGRRAARAMSNAKNRAARNGGKSKRGCVR